MSRRAKVDQSHDGSIHHDVAQLDVAMAELVGVQVADRVDHPDEESAGLLGRQRAAIPRRVLGALDVVREGAAGSIVHA